MDLFKVVPILEEITFTDVKEKAEHLIDEQYITVCKVLPKNN